MESERKEHSAISGRRSPLKWRSCIWSHGTAASRVSLFLLEFGVGSGWDSTIHKYQAAIQQYHRSDLQSPCPSFRHTASRRLRPSLTTCLHIQHSFSIEFPPAPTSPIAQQRSLRRSRGRSSVRTSRSSVDRCYEACSTGLICTSPIWPDREGTRYPNQ